jgi:sulfoxide reductase heme-binding subunit YedZ
VWHFYWQVKRDVREPLVYIGILAVLLGYRIVRQRQQAALRTRAGTARGVTSTSAPATAPERT